uniref:Bestrophin homolog n=1 Tax=Steinernema glaseri TaxID=37863 RepID=A0A1I7ZZ25_9BILA
NDSAMTVTYTLEVSRARFWGFPKLLARWRGSIYRLMYREMAVFLLAFYAVALGYRYLLSAPGQRQFERIAVYCREFTSVVPITFVLGFFVSVIVGRWWQQYMAIPWPDRVAMQVSAYIQGADERGRIIRRTMARYLVLISVLTFQNTSTVIKRRFPTMDHLVECGLMSEDEKVEIEELVTPHGNWWIPAQWFSQLAMVARKEGRIHDDLHLKTLIDEMMDYRGLCGLIFSYDWISVPLVYTQVVTIAVYSFFTACLFGRQYLFDTPSTTGIDTPMLNPSGHDIDFYMPIFTIFQFFFYVGWLKVAESMICPFGEDDDDFDLNWIIDRNVSVAYTIVDQMYRRTPKLTRDVFWETTDPEIPYSRAAAAYRRDPFYGSTTNMNISNREAAWDMPAEMTPIDEEGMVGMPFPVTSPSKKPHKLSGRSHGSKQFNTSRSTGDKSPDDLDSGSEGDEDRDADVEGDEDDDGRSISSRQLDEKRRRKGLFGLLLGTSRQTLSSRLESRYGSRQSVCQSPPPMPISMSRRNTHSRNRVGSSIVRQSRGSSPVLNCTQQDETQRDREEYHQKSIQGNLHNDRACGSSGNSTSAASNTNLFYEKVDVPPPVKEEPEPGNDRSRHANSSYYRKHIEEPPTASRATLAQTPGLATVEEVVSIKNTHSTTGSDAGSSDSSNNGLMGRMSNSDSRSLLLPSDSGK